MPLLFAYGINRFSHDLANMVKTFRNLEKKKICMFQVSAWKKIRYGTLGKYFILS